MKPRYKLLIGDCRETLRSLESESVQMCVTSPPYFGLRDYQADGQFGLENSPDDYVSGLVEIMREVRRVLRDDGTLWLNLGDSYVRTGGSDRKRSPTATVGSTQRSMESMPNRNQRAPKNLPQKNLIGIPWRVAFALQADGWFLRQDIIWSKPNPMPASYTDRCTTSHEYIFLLTKSKKYYYNHHAIKEPMAASSLSRLTQPNISEQEGSRRGMGRESRPMHAVGSAMSFKRDNSKRGVAMHGSTTGTHRPDRLDTIYDGTRNKWSVWEVATSKFKGVHTAMFPPKLIEPCILAGSPAGASVLDPFGGSGTTAGVALAHGRNAIICEINSSYADIVPSRVSSIMEKMAVKK